MTDIYFDSVTMEVKMRQIYIPKFDGINPLPQTNV
jgi:hypothetical protein